MERCNMVVPQSSSFPQDTGISQLSSYGARLEPWNKDREHGEHPQMLAYDAKTKDSASINRCRQAWLHSSRSFLRRLEHTHK